MKKVAPTLADINREAARLLKRSLEQQAAATSWWVHCLHDSSPHTPETYRAYVESTESKAE